MLIVKAAKESIRFCKIERQLSQHTRRQRSHRLIGKDRVANPLFPWLLAEYDIHIPEFPMSYFVWTKMQAEAGLSLDDIIARKEVERLRGDGRFWWGIGNSLGPAVREAAIEAGGMLPVLFSKMLAQPQAHDIAPAEIFRWTSWEDGAGVVHDIPSYANVTSRGGPNKKSHYALVCRSDNSIVFHDQGPPFDPTQCTTRAGRVPGASQVTSLLNGSPEIHSIGKYTICFRALLVDPWVVKLVRPMLAPLRERS